MPLANALPRFLRWPQPATAPQSQLPIALVGYSAAGKDFLAYGLLKELYTATGLFSLAFRTRVGPPYCRVSLDSGTNWTVPECYPNFALYEQFGEVPSTSHHAGGPQCGGAGAIGIQVGTLGPGGKEVNFLLWNTVGQDPAIVENAGAYLFCMKALDLDPWLRKTHARGRPTGKLVLQSTFVNWCKTIGQEVNVLEKRRLPFAIVLTACDELFSGARVHDALGFDFWRVWKQFSQVDARTADHGWIYKAAAMTRWATPRLWKMLAKDPLFGPPLKQLVGERSLPPIFLTSAVDGKLLTRGDGTREETPTTEQLEEGPRPILASAPFLYLLTKMRPHEFNFGNW